MSDKIKENISAHDLIAKKYDLKHTEIYNNIEQNRIKNTINGLLKKLNNQNPKVLDFGSGTGNLTKYFLDFGCEVIACDVSNKSLSILKEKFRNNNPKVILISGEKLPFRDNSFDIVATYSVLHHIPNYLSAIKEMIRVTKKGGIIYIDHEANENRYFPNGDLKEYQNLTKQTIKEHVLKLIKTKELFTYSFLKTLVMKLFINTRYEREGDIHVWKDDYIDWEKIKKLIKENNCKVIKEEDYLIYEPKGGIRLFYEYKDKCNDTQYILIKK